MRITVGSVGGSGSEIHQLVHCLPDDSHKWGWLSSHLASFVSAGKLLVFVASKAGCDALAENIPALLAGMGGGVVHRCEGLHGDRMQHERAKILREFRTGTTTLGACA